MIQKYKKEDEAKVCAGNNCVTVKGDAARIISAIAVLVVLVVGISVIAKAVK